MKGLTIFFLLIIATVLEAQNSYSKIVAISTIVDKTSGTISLKWDKIALASGYAIARKLRNDTSWTSIVTLTNNSISTYTDTISNQSVGYEYKIITLGSAIVASGYAYAAINLPPKHYTGKLILLIDSAYADYCSREISQYVLDIIKEGWTCKLQYVGRTTSVASVKQIIKTIYLQDPSNTKGVFILGHIAIPYSGDIYPDGHPNHEGAWPTDLCYADTSNLKWTDTSVNLTSASRPANRNILGDGKFDQWAITPYDVKLFVTRVDLFDMPAINNNDSLLTKNYLSKDHAYRSLQNIFRMRALVDDNFGYFSGEAFGQNGYRNGVNLLGKDSVLDGDYFTSMNAADKSCLWSFGCGSGSYTSAGGIGNTSDFQSQPVKSVFTMLFGSYFGDWDNTNNFLRAPLASNSSVLTNCWAGRPNWFFHAMGLGECIGFSAFAHVKNPELYVPTNYGSNFIHTELLGDPTLKMYVYEPPQNLVLTNVSSVTTKIAWSASIDTNVTGYYLYKTNALSNPFTLINANPVSTLSFIDSSVLPGNNIYMIRAVKPQSTISSGTFNNLSAGIIDSITSLVTLPVQLLGFTLINNDCNVNLEWVVAHEQNIRQYEVLFSTDGIQYTLLRKIDATNSSSYRTTHNQVCVLYQGKTIYYKLKITDGNGSFVFSNIITAKINNTRNLSIYENPVNDYLTIKGLEKVGNIRVVNVNGEMLYKQNVYQESLKMNASFLTSGIYFLQYFNGGITTSLKFVKR